MGHFQIFQVCGCAGARQGGSAAAGGGGAAREDVGAGYQQEEQPRAVRRQGGGQPRQHRVGSPGGQQYSWNQMSTKFSSHSR